MKKKTRESAERYIELFEMSDVKHHFVESFSKGMQQKAMIIIALTIRPNLYIFDEPFIGLDPRATRVLLEILQEERQRGAELLCLLTFLIRQNGCVIALFSSIKGVFSLMVTYV